LFDTYKMRMLICSLAAIVAIVTMFFAPVERSVMALPQSQMLNEIKANSGDLAPSAASALLLEADTGNIIYEKNMHAILPPASITKLMTMLIIMEELEKKSLHLTDIVYASEYAASMGGSQLYLEPGDKFTVDEMLKGITLQSANDASLAVAEHIAGTEQAFVKRMNERAKQLGMKNTKFANPHGLPVDDEMKNHYSTAYDIALMSRELLKYENILHYTSTVNYVLTQNNGKPFDMYNSNRMIGNYEGMDGLKTGYTNTARHCLVATAKRDGMRLLAIVLGEPDKLTRTAEVTSMLDYGFAQFQTISFVKKGEPLGVISIYKGKQQEHTYMSPKTYSVLIEKNDKIAQYRHKVTLSERVKAPVKPGAIAGTVTIYNGNEIVEEYPLPLDITVEKAGFWDFTGYVFRTLFFVE